MLGQASWGLDKRNVCNYIYSFCAYINLCYVWASHQHWRACFNRASLYVADRPLIVHSSAKWTCHDHRPTGSSVGNSCRSACRQAEKTKGRSSEPVKSTVASRANTVPTGVQPSACTVNIGTPDRSDRLQFRSSDVLAVSKSEAVESLSAVSAMLCPPRGVVDRLVAEALLSIWKRPPALSPD